jgi:hypothetical protein
MNTTWSSHDVQRQSENRDYGDSDYGDSAPIPLFLEAAVSRKGMMELEAALNDPVNQIGSGAWARASSDEALEYHLEGTDPGSLSYEMAARELARRDAARSENLQLRWIKRTFWATIVLGAAAIAATLFA